LIARWTVYGQLCQALSPVLRPENENVRPQMIVQSISGQRGRHLAPIQPIEFTTRGKTIYYLISMINEWRFGLEQWAKVRNFEVDSRFLYQSQEVYLTFSCPSTYIFLVIDPFIVEGSNIYRF